MNIQETIDKFIENFQDEHNSTYFSGEYYVPSTNCVVDFVRMDYETYDEDQKTFEEVKEDIRGFLTRDFSGLVSKTLDSYALYDESCGEPTNVDIFHGVTFKRYIAGKEANSYTIYLAMAVEW